jgi:hypothetical protein
MADNIDDRLWNLANYGLSNDEIKSMKSWQDAAKRSFFWSTIKGAIGSFRLNLEGRLAYESWDQDRKNNFERLLPDVPMAMRHKFFTMMRETNLTEIPEEITTYGNATPELQSLYRDGKITIAKIKELNKVPEDQHFELLDKINYDDSDFVSEVSKFLMRDSNEREVRAIVHEVFDGYTHSGEDPPTESQVEESKRLEKKVLDYISRISHARHTSW